MNRLNLKYGAALLAAPLFVLLYISLFQHNIPNLQTILANKQALLFTLLLYPVVEELAFRGVILELIASQTKKVPSHYGITLANVLTSSLFVLIHFVYHAPLWAVLVFVPSLIFGYFKEQYGSILPSIGLHMFYNLCALLLIV